MQFILKISISLIVITTCALLSRKAPSMAGLIAVMPLSGVIVLFWIYSENKNDMLLLSQYTRGALLGIFPTILFYLSAYICFMRKVHITPTLVISFGVWLIAAAIHQLLSGK